jgi:hypothetical protein
VLLLLRYDERTGVPPDADLLASVAVGSLSSGFNGTASVGLVRGGAVAAGSE